MEEINYDILHQLHPAIRKFIVYIWEQEKLGVGSRTIQIQKISSSMKKNEGVDTKYANRFNVKIPYVGRFIEWEARFCNDDMSFAPDFDLGDDEFIMDYKLEKISEKLPSWSKWNPTNPSSLYKVLMELLDLYKAHQVRKLKTEIFSKIYFEFLSLMEESTICTDQIEVFIEPSGVVHFLIALAIDFSFLPPEYIKYSCPKDSNIAVLMVTFTRLDASNVQSQINFPPSIDQNMLGFGNKQIPALPNSDCLVDYIPAIQRLVQEKIKFIVDNYTLKQSYITQLLTQFSNQMLEYDIVNHSKATLMFETENFNWLLIIVINNNFPKEKPKWTMRSVYHMTFDEPTTEILYDYPYSPRWCSEEMINRAMKYAIDKIPLFQAKKK